MSDMEDKDNIFKLIQDYLKPCPVIIWGSGGTIPFGMPSMQQLKEHLEIKEEGNIEKILADLINDDDEKKCEYKNKIFKFIDGYDKKLRGEIRKDHSMLGPLNSIIKYCYCAHPHNLNIITTNYDCVLEYCLSVNQLPYSDGFSGREFSKFDKENFRKQDCINVIKVHGSLRWTKNSYCYYSYFNEDMEAILPTANKFKEVFEEPFRTLIRKSENIISESKSILSIGFGFNDEHLTPTINDVIRDNSKIVIVAKKATEAIKEKVKSANKFILIEEAEGGKTKFSFKEEIEQEIITTGNYWKLDEFARIVNK